MRFIRLTMCGFSFSQQMALSLSVLFCSQGILVQTPRNLILIRCLERSHTPCVKPTPPDVLALCCPPSLPPSHSLTFPVLPRGAEWAGRGWLSPPGGPAAQDSCLGSPVPAPRAQHLTAQEHVPLGTRGLAGGQIPVLSSSNFLVLQSLFMSLTQAGFRSTI